MKLLSLHRAAWRGLAAVICLGALSATQGCATSTEEALDTGSESAAPANEPNQADIQQALRAVPDARVIGARKGVPFFVRGTLGQVTNEKGDLGGARAQAELSAALRTVAPMFRLDAEQLQFMRSRVDEQGHRHVRYQQMEQGLPVIGGELIVHVDDTGRIYAANGSARGGSAPSPRATVTAAAAQAAALGHDAAAHARAEDAPRLVYYREKGTDALALAWEVRALGEQDGTPVDDLIFIDAHRGAVLAVHPQVHNELNRKVYSANNTTTLPGTLRRSEGDAATNDAVVNDNYSRLFRPYNCYSRYFGRNSYDNAGATVKSSVHYDSSYNNAFWSASAKQFAFGDGDGTQFSPLGSDPDITVHEFTHAVTSSESNLTYSGESGALNEAMSDIFAAFCSSELGGVWEMNDRVWRIGEDSYTPNTANDALRYMDNPTSDGSSRDYYPERYTGSFDNGGVHWNSGIANLAFKLLAAGGSHPRSKTTVTVAGIGVEAAGRIFYKANIDFFTSSTSFVDAKTYTEQAAQALGYDGSVVESVSNAWLAVGVGDGIAGHVDDITSNGGIRGWAFDRQSSSDSITMHYYIGGPTGSGAPLFIGSTNVDRPDVNAAFSISGTHGFALPIPQQYYDGAPHAVYVYGLDQQGIFNPLIDGTAYTFNFAGAEGHVDSVGSDGVVRGWALDVNSKSTSIAVHYYIGGPAGSGAAGFATTANISRPDVNSVWGATGDHGFQFTVPAQYQDGYSHSIYVYAIDAQGLHNPLLDGKAYYFTVGTPPDPGPGQCTSGIYCECTGTCVKSQYTCDKLCGW
jgi:Zn-dependent metalloprotease